MPIHSFFAPLALPVVFIGFSVVFGLVIGSFLNVVIHRLPKMLERDWAAQCAELMTDQQAPVKRKRPRDREARLLLRKRPWRPDNGGTEPFVYNLAVPRSACPGCGAQITALQNIPIISWLALRGKCANCRTPISARYPLVEAATGILTGVCAWHFGYNAAAFASMLFVCCMLALSFIDYDTQLLPDDITLPLVWAGLLVNMGGVFTDLKSAVIGAVAGYLVLWSVYWLFKLVTGKEGMGFGDFKLLAAIGAWLGWQMLILVVLLSSLVGAVVGVSLILFAGHGRAKPIPFGPYLASAGVIALFWGRELNHAYLGLM